MRKTTKRAAGLGIVVLFSGIALGVGGSNVSTSSPGGSAAAVEPGAVRLGTYDNRAVAIAYVRSGHGPMNAKMAEYEEARAAGDKARVKELEAWGTMQQRELHFQGFGRCPVDEMLAEVSDGLAKVAAGHGLDAIVWLPSYSGDDVVLVDVTEDLVKLFTEDKQVVKAAMQIKDKPFVPFETLVEMDPKN